MSTKKKVEGGINFGKLKEACKIFNEREYKDVKGNIINIKYVAKAVPVIIENFMSCCEALPPKVQQDMSDDDILAVMFGEIEVELQKQHDKDEAEKVEGKKVETVVITSEDVVKVEEVLEKKPVEEEKQEVVEEKKEETVVPEKVELEKGKKPVEKKGDKKYTRFDSIRDALVKGGDKTEVVKAADSLYVENGGTSNTKESSWAYGLSVNVLVTFGFAQVVDDKVKIGS